MGNTTSTFTTDINNSSNSNNSLCDGLECYSKPSQKLKIDCGKYGSLTVFLCDRCSSNFTTSGKKMVTSKADSDFKTSYRKNNKPICDYSEENEKRGKTIHSANYINSEVTESEHSELDRRNKPITAGDKMLANKSENLLTRESTRDEFYK